MPAPDNDNSFITLHRKITRWGWYTDGNTMRVFLHLILQANYKATEWRGETILRGQLLTGRKQMAAELGLSEQKIRTALSKLNSTNEITISATKRYSVITVCNYSDYQDKKDQKQPRGQPSGQPTSNQQVTTSNKGNKGNNKKKTNTTPIGAVLSPGFSDEFMEKVWAYYAKHKVKPYRSISVQNIALQQLFEKCGGNEEMAKDALRETLTNTYQGFTWYFKRNQQGGGTNGSQERNGGSQDRQPTKADHAALMQQLVDRTTGMG